MFPGSQARELERRSDQRLQEVRPSDLGPPLNDAEELLSFVTEDGWFNREQRLSCPQCGEVVAGRTASGVCPVCGEAYDDHGGLRVDTVYVRNLAQLRDVAWAVAIHGMNTKGAWQEEFSWYFGTTWGRSVPVAVYKYGIVISGVIMAWRRRHLQRRLRSKLAVLAEQAEAQGFDGKPDVIAHSFGTWLLGHLLEAELERDVLNRLRFGRVILTGCILRPDFDWGRIKAEGLVEEVMNHYGSRDPIVPCAQFTISDSGPSGRRGFDGHEVINIRAEGYRHSDLFATHKCVGDGDSLRTCVGGEGETRALEHAYKRYWRPFLTLPGAEFGRLENRVDPPSPWRPMPAPLRGTVFPFVMLPFALALALLVLAGLGFGLSHIWKPLGIAAAVGATCLAVLFVGAGAVVLGRRLSRG
jgi:hypothetical protein